MYKYLFVFVALCLCTLSSSAFDFEVDGIQYSYKEDGVAISSVSKSLESAYTILETVSYSGKDYKVIAVGENAFEKHNEITSITIPASISSIGMFAFTECSNLSEVIFNDSEETITIDAKPFDKSPIKKMYIGRERKFTYY